MAEWSSDRDLFAQRWLEVRALLGAGTIIKFMTASLYRTNRNKAVPVTILGDDLRMKNKKYCLWEYNDIDDFYETPCNNSGYAFTEGTIKENKFKFCPYCGKKIRGKL